MDHQFLHREQTVSLRKINPVSPVQGNSCFLFLEGSYDCA